MYVPDVASRLRSRLTGVVRLGEPMSRHTTFRVGGRAAYYVELETVHDVAVAVALLSEEGVPFTVIGKGSNLLVSDSGYEGAVLVLGREFRRHSIEDGTLRAGAGTILGVLVQEAFHHGLAGLSWAVGIPGTLGGALAMNAGARDGTIGDCVDTVTLYELSGGLRLVHGHEVVWAYRSSGLAERGIILEAVLAVPPGDKARIRAEMERYLKARKASQPLGVPSAGSVFVNPEGRYAGQLIETAGCKGLTLGGAAVSPVHANFIVNVGGAKASDVFGLMRTIQAMVRETHGVDLRPEIRFLGRFEEA
jgi:UDP-N-acetylmuramate dehydrogenase